MKWILSVIFLVGILCGDAWGGDGVFNYKSAKKDGASDQDIAKFLSNEFRPDAVGRFVCIPKGEAGNPIYIFDTQTGRLWRSVYRTDGLSERILTPVFYKKYIVKNNKVESELGILPNKPSVDALIVKDSK